MCREYCSRSARSSRRRASIAPWTRCSDWGLVNQADRVLIWSSQLRANDFPPVCAMTGAPAEAWHKFRFVTVPGWAYASLLLLLHRHRPPADLHHHGRRLAAGNWIPAPHALEPDEDPPRHMGA